MDILKTVVNQLQLVDKMVFPEDPAEVIVKENISAEVINKVATYLPRENIYLIFGKNLPEILKKYIAEMRLGEFIFELVAHEVRHRVQCSFQLILCLPGMEEAPQTLREVIEFKIQSLPAEGLATEVARKEFDADVISKWALISRKYEGISLANLANILKWGI